MGRRGDREGVWVGNQDFGSRRWAAIAAVLSLTTSAAGAVYGAMRGDDPIAFSGGAVLCIGAMGFFLPPALLGRHRSAGIRLVATCLLIMAAAMALWTVVGRVDPDSFSGYRGPLIKAISPLAVVLFGALGGYLMWKSFRKIEPTDYDARHAEHD